MTKENKLILLRNAIYTYYKYSGKDHPAIAAKIEAYTAEKEALIALCNEDEVLRKVKENLTDLRDYHRQELINACCTWWDMNFYLLPEVERYGYQQSKSPITEIPDVGATGGLIHEENYGLVGFNTYSGITLIIEGAQTGGFFDSHNSGTTFIGAIEDIESLYKTMIRSMKVIQRETPSSKIKVSPFIEWNKVNDEELLEAKIAEALTLLDNSGIIEELEMTDDDWTSLIHNRRMPDKARELLHTWIEMKRAESRMDEAIASTEA